MQNITAIEFAALVKDLTLASRCAGLQAPSFRTPPHSRKQARTIKRYRDGSALVSVSIHNRDRSDVIADLIEGIVVVNRLPARLAVPAKRTLWRSLLPQLQDAA